MAVDSILVEKNRRDCLFTLEIVYLLVKLHSPLLFWPPARNFSGKSFSICSLMVLYLVTRHCFGGNKI